MNTMHLEVTSTSALIIKSKWMLGKMNNSCTGYFQRKDHQMSKSTIMRRYKRISEKYKNEDIEGLKVSDKLLRSWVCS